MKCSYCTSEIERGTGLVYVKRNGAIRYYCSDRCYKYSELYRKKPSKKEIALSAKAKP
jgi:large subunit ribosomal protein L24e